MCLARIDKQFDPPQKRERWAWKIFCRNSKGRLLPAVYAPSGLRVLWNRQDAKPIRTGAWLKAEKKAILSCEYITNGRGYRTYTSGFHCCLTKKDAVQLAEWMAWDDSPSPRRVRVRGVRTIGTQEGMPCLVADEMFVPKEAVVAAKKRKGA